MFADDEETDFIFDRGRDLCNFPLGVWVPFSLPSGCPLHFPLGALFTSLWVPSSLPSGCPLHFSLGALFTSLWVPSTLPLGALFTGMQGMHLPDEFLATPTPLDLYKLFINDTMIRLFKTETNVCKGHNTNCLNIV